MPDLQARQVARVLFDDWRVTSYSGLQQRGHSIAQDLMPRLDVDAAGTGEVVQEPELTPHQFPRVPRQAPFYTACLKRSILPNPFPRSGRWRCCRKAGMTPAGSRS